MTADVVIPQDVHVNQEETTDTSTCKFQCYETSYRTTAEDDSTFLQHDVRFQDTCITGEDVHLQLNRFQIALNTCTINKLNGIVFIISRNLTCFKFCWFFCIELANNNRCNTTHLGSYIINTYYIIIITFFKVVSPKSSFFIGHTIRITNGWLTSLTLHEFIWIKFLSHITFCL